MQHIAMNKILQRFDAQKYSSVIEKLPRKFYLVNNIGNW